MGEHQKYIEIITEISNKHVQIKKVLPMLSASKLKYFDNEFSISASYNSNAIEGNTFTFEEAKTLIERGIITGTHLLREGEDIFGYKQAIDYLYESAKTKQTISEELLKKVHRLVLRGDDNAGKYRTIQNYIGNSTRILYTPNSPTQVQEKMKMYMEELQADLMKNVALAQQGQHNWAELFRSLAKHHIAFENIHPFIDGNGRVGRLLIMYEMISLGLFPIDIRYEDRDRYYLAIELCRDKENHKINFESNAEYMTELLAERELASMKLWLSIYA